MIRVSRRILKKIVSLACLGLMLALLTSFSGCAQPAYQTNIANYTQALRDKDALVRSTAANHLRRLGTAAQSAVPELIEALEDENIRVRQSAAAALGKIHAQPDTTVPALAQTLIETEDDHVRQAAAIALSRFGASAVPALTDVLARGDRASQLSATVALREIGPAAKAAVPALTSLYENGQPEMQEQAIVALGQIEAEEALAILKAALTHTDWRVRASAARALGNLPAGEGLPGLIAALGDEEAIVRQQATEALGRLDAESVPALTDLLGDSQQSAQLRSYAAYALADMGPEAQTAIPVLTSVLGSDQAAIANGATVALEKIGLPAVPALTQLLQSQTGRERNAAASILNEIANQLQNRIDPLGFGDASTSDLSWADLNQSISLLSEAQIVIAAETAPLQEVNFPDEVVSSFQQSVRALIDHRNARLFGSILRGLFWIVILLGIAGIFVWSRPIILLRASRAIINARSERALFEQRSSIVQRFLAQAGTAVEPGSQRSLKILSASGRLKSLAPLPVLIALDQPTAEDVSELVQRAERLGQQNQKKGGILVYREPPDTLFRVRMAEVRLRDRFILIPMPFVAIEQAIVSTGACAGLLAQYCDRYLPGADLFDDRNAIGDTLSFFGRSELLNRLEEDLKRGQGVGLFGLRKSGKTSILLQLGFSLRQHPVIHLDLQPYGGRLRFGAELFNTICKQLVLLIQDRDDSFTPSFKPFAIEASAATLTTQFIERISHLSESLSQVGYLLPILLFLDEVERILPTSVDPAARVVEFNAFFGSLRALSQEKRQLGLLVADVHPDCNRINQWTQAGVPTNPVFNFFKEILLSPFTHRETVTMLTDISRLMGREFDEQTLTAIHHESGGHPFIARQVASLLCSKIPEQKSRNVTWQTVQRYVEQPFIYSSVLKDYFGQNIWADLSKRDFNAAMEILKILASNPQTQVSGQDLKKLLKQRFTESQSIDALLWLEMVGLIERSENQTIDSYLSKMSLLSRWLQMEMDEEEMQTWQVR